MNTELLSVIDRLTQWRDYYWRLSLLAASTARVSKDWELHYTFKSLSESIDECINILESNSEVPIDITGFEHVKFGEIPDYESRSVSAGFNHGNINFIDMIEKK